MKTLRDLEKSGEITISKIEMDISLENFGKMYKMLSKRSKKGSISCSKVEYDLMKRLFEPQERIYKDGKLMVGSSTLEVQ